MSGRSEAYQRLRQAIKCTRITPQGVSGRGAELVNSFRSTRCCGGGAIVPPQGTSVGCPGYTVHLHLYVLCILRVSNAASNVSTLLYLANGVHKSGSTIVGFHI